MSVLPRRAPTVSSTPQKLKPDTLPRDWACQVAEKTTRFAYMADDKCHHCEPFGYHGTLGHSISSDALEIIEQRLVYAQPCSSVDTGVLDAGGC